VISYGLAAVLSLFLAEVKEEGKERMSVKAFCGSLRQTFTDKRLFLLLLGVAFLNETHQTVTVFLNQLLYVRAGMSNALIGYLYIVVTIVGMSCIFSAAVTKKTGRVFLIRACYLTAAAVCLLLAFGRNGWGAAMGIMVLRFAFSLFAPLQTQLQNERIMMVERATALSINAVIIDSVGVGTNLIYGALAEKSLTAALVSGAALCAVGLVFIERGMKYV
ncbi:MAG: MFS transporter, partial [Lachnospiraceae bacterium]|nr:MFS transporter [Lachnospiraceae bacterium]